MNAFHRPDWVPTLAQGTRVLVIGASGGIGRAVVDMIADHSPGCVVGAHWSSRPVQRADVIAVRREFRQPADCQAVIDDFVAKAGGLDALVVLSGGLSSTRHWRDLDPLDWQRDLDANLSHPFYLARAAMAVMAGQGGGGRVVLNGTESAAHGGSPTGMGYAVAKRGIDCLVKGLARDGAADGILVNGVQLGFIDSGFHARWQGRTDADLARRAQMVPLKRAGHPDEAAALILYLLSGWGAFITGQMLSLSGGDWL